MPSFSSSLRFFVALLSTPFVTSAPSILLPLYIYPGDNAANWTPLFDALTAHPTVPITVIIDPDSGPGTDTYPDSNYIFGLETLHTHSNVRVIGYAHTSFATQPLSAVQADVTRYAGWSNYSGGNISVQGIFLDEAPNDDSSTSVDYMQNALQIVRDTISVPGGEAYVVFNPGDSTSAAYFSPTPPDLSVQFENYYSALPATGPIAPYPSGEVARSAVIAHDVPTAADATSFVQRAVTDGVGAVRATDDAFYTSLDYIEQVIAAL